MQICFLHQDAMALIKKAEVEEKRVYMDNTALSHNSKIADTFTVTPTKVPPPPILLCRTDSEMVFKPAPFQPTGGEKVL